jgi:hypothetical protein
MPAVSFIILRGADCFVAERLPRFVAAQALAGFLGALSGPDDGAAKY